MLFRRKGIFYFRQSIPVELRKRFGGCAEFKKSLKTKDRKEAKILAAVCGHKVESLLFVVRWRMITDEQAQKIRSKIIGETIEDLYNHECLFPNGDLSFALNPDSKHLWTHDQVIKALGSETITHDNPLTYHALDVFNNLRDNRINPIIAQKARDIANDCGLEIVLPDFDPSAEENILVCDSALYKDFIDLCTIIAKSMLDIFENEFGKGAEERDRSLSREIIKTYKDGLPAPKLSELWNSFYQDKTTRNEWRERTAEKYAAAFNVVLDILGDLALDHIDSDTCLKLTKGLKKYPSNKNKKAQFKDKPFVPEMSKLPSFKMLSEKSINFHIGLMSGIFNFALEDRRRWRIDQNPFAKKQLKEVHAKEAHELRRVFTREEIEEIFVELSTVRRLVEPGKFWAPLICLYSGMRINEACQLRTGDVEFIDDIPVFQIQHRPKLYQETKNGKSRTVPIHKMLQHIGFIDFLNFQKKKKEERLFPELKLFKGKWHRTVDNWFNRTVLRSHMKKMVMSHFIQQSILL